MATTKKKRGYDDELGFSYHSKGTRTNKSNIKVTRYACIYDKKDRRGLSCDGSLNLNTFPDGTQIEVKKHLHNEACIAKWKSAVESGKKEVEDLRKQFMEKVKEESTNRRTKDIYDALMAETDLNLSKKLPFKRVERQARRVKSAAKKRNIALPDVTGV